MQQLITLALAVATALGFTPQAQAAPAPTANVVVVPWNERSAPPLAQWQYRHDISAARTSVWGVTHADAYLQAEFHSGRTRERQRAIVYTRNNGLYYRQLVSDDTAVTTRTRPSASRGFWLLGYRPAGPYTSRPEVNASWVNEHGFRVVFAALHLTGGCWPGDRGKWWYGSRCQARRTEFTNLRRWIARQHAHGWTVIVGGDVNSERYPSLGAREVANPIRSDMLAAVIPANGVTARIVGLRWYGGNGHPFWTDHQTPRVTFNLRS